MISLRTWIRIRDRVDEYFRARELRQRRILVAGKRATAAETKDVTPSESAEKARRAGNLLIRQGGRQPASPEDVEVTSRSYDDMVRPTFVGNFVHTDDGHMLLELKAEVSESLNLREGDRIEFRRLDSGELLTTVERQAR